MAELSQEQLRKLQIQLMQKSGEIPEEGFIDSSTNYLKSLLTTPTSRKSDLMRRGKQIGASYINKEPEKQDIQKTGAGIAENILANTATNVLSNVLTPRQSVQLTGEVPSMAPMYDTSGYRALDIIGAGIAKRPTQEAYFNRLEAIQNERLQEEYNRRTDTPEAKNAQELLRKVFGNTIDEDIINKVSVRYLADNYPMLAQMAESRDTARAKIDNDSKAKDFIQQFYPQITASQLKTVTASNYKDVAKKLDDDKAQEISLQIKKRNLNDVNTIKEAKKKNDVPKLTEAQTKLKLGLDRQTEANDLIEQLLKEGYDPYSRFNTPALEQRAENAINLFVYGTLRPESGAVIGEPELKSYKETFFGSPSMLIMGKGREQLMKENKQRRLNAINSTKSLISNVLPKEEFNEGGIYEEDDGRVFKYTKGKKVYL